MYIFVPLAKILNEAAKRSHPGQYVQHCIMIHVAKCKKRQMCFKDLSAISDLLVISTHEKHVSCVISCVKGPVIDCPC